MTTLAFAPQDTPFSPAFNNAVTDIPAGLALILDLAGTGATTSDTWVRLPTAAETGLVPRYLTYSVMKTKSMEPVVARPGCLVPCIAGAAVAKGVYVKASSVAGQLGRLIAAADTEPYVGFSESPAAAAGDLFYVRYNPGAHA